MIFSWNTGRIDRIAIVCSHRANGADSSEDREIDPFNSFLELHEWLRRLRSEQSLSQVVGVVAKVLETTKGDNHRFLSDELAWLLREAGRHRDALQVLDGSLQRYPDDVRPAISKANIYFYSLDQPEEALKWIDVAWERADRTRFWRREVFGNKARILLKLGRGDELSDVLEDIMALQIVNGVPDIGRERDFVDRAPPGLIRKNVLERYNEFRPRRAGDDSSTDEPPEFEYPDDAM